MPYFPTRKVTIFAKDASVRTPAGDILRTQIEIPNETLGAGPRGYRVQVADFDASTGKLYKTMAEPPNRSNGMPPDPFEDKSDDELLNSPDFHAMSAYAVVMRTLARFEHALGRRVAWAFPGHQIQLAPHAFADANAFYSPDDQALMFGYFPKAGDGRHVFSCLAHDIVAHETTHALLDGLRQRYTDPSSPEQAGFHEGFADIVALLSMFSLGKVVERVLDPAQIGPKMKAKNVGPEALRNSILTGLGKEFGEELSGIRGDVLRRSVNLEPGVDYLHEEEFEEPHRRGEVLVAAIINAFLEVWSHRLQALKHDGEIDRQRTVEEGADVADHLLTICVRALDYCPPTDLQFCDFASALLTADWEMYPKDQKYRFRRHLRQSFQAYGIKPTSDGKGEMGTWDPPDTKMRYDRTHFAEMQRDPNELFRFLWENRKAFKMHDGAYTRVLSVRPCIRVGGDGFALHETAVEYLQLLKIRANELAQLDIRKPPAMPGTQEVTLYGGNALILDQYGQVKYSIGNSIFNAETQSSRLEYLWEHAFFSPGSTKLQRFAAMHRVRATGRFSSGASREANWAVAAAVNGETHNAD
ncbi:MAG TPA: hypothetical protein VN428_09755 [Bryobacteraceae bacterium]|nr:hypothetical protein [Bryobacteraceae bacterium]